MDSYDFVAEEVDKSKHRDWVGNNAAVQCPACFKVYLVSLLIHHGNRACPHCEHSSAHIVGGRESGGTAKLEWQAAKDGPLNTRNDPFGFARRTMTNLDQIEAQRAAGNKQVHVVTQRVLCLLGLVVYPFQSGFENNLKSLKLEKIAEEGWPTWHTFLGTNKTLGQLVRHLRNAVCHRNLIFLSDSADPAQVRIQFWDQNGKSDPHWRVEISADDLLIFCRKFVELVYTSPTG